MAPRSLAARNGLSNGHLWPSEGPSRGWATFQLLRAALAARQTFFESGPLRGHDIRALLRYMLFASWADLYTFMLESGPSRPRGPF